MRVRKRRDLTLLGRNEADAISYLLNGCAEEEAVRDQLNGLREFERLGGGWTRIEFDVDPGAPEARELPSHYRLGSAAQHRGDGACDPGLSWTSRRTSCGRSRSTPTTRS